MHNKYRFNKINRKEKFVFVKAECVEYKVNESKSNVYFVLSIQLTLLMKRWRSFLRTQIRSMVNS